MNARGLQIKYESVFYESLLVPVLLCDSEIMVQREKERSRIGTMQMDKLRGFLVLG